MSIFIKIDPRIAEISELVNGVLSIDRLSYPKALRKFEERRIDWELNGIKKAIIIQPTFEVDGVNSDLWNFRIVAWSSINKKRVSFVKNLVSKGTFTSIESNINELLINGKEILENVQLNDLE